MLLENEEKKVIKIDGTEKDMNKPINEYFIPLFRKLYHEYSRFRSSLLCLLTYTSLCQCKWAHVLKFSE